MQYELFGVHLVGKKYSNLQDCHETQFEHSERLWEMARAWICIASVGQIIFFLILSETKVPSYCRFFLNMRKMIMSMQITLEFMLKMWNR